ncbi:hypothetical protein [Amycolatopsis sp. RTGN1]|uniref:hypothetical protein n=1 Tax=Amycolatopsis ponsaeliensis TaxID=2992142 RepID=UPI00254A60E6|nr:hypothetical protein [Amycolatopsis sp. RTGN1]
MIITLSRPAITLAGTPDPAIEAIVNLMPDYSAGRRLHALYVNKTQSALPGTYSQLFGTGPAFRSVFYPGWRADPLLAAANATGLADSWWRDFSVAVLCQAIAELGSNIRGQMLADEIRGAVAAFNAQLRARSARAYATVLGATYGPLVDLLHKVNRDVAKARFHESLLNNVLNRQLWYQAGMWTSPDWELFNQYAKYLVLGATDAEVDVLIRELGDAGLPVPAVVNEQNWRSYAEELRDKREVDVTDVRDACARPVSETTYVATYGGGLASIPNGNSYEFTASSQPGTRYRRAPGGSCFTGDTHVLGEDGHPVPLRTVKRGDVVLTRDGKATVAYVAQPLRGGRPLYRPAGGGPVFTGTHPFLNAAPEHPQAPPPAVLAVDPVALAADVPTFGEGGVGALAPGALVLSRAPGHAPAPVRVAGIDPVTHEDTHLYDLRLVPGSGARQEFWAGDGERFYLVSPEYPILDEAGPAATTVVSVMEGLLRSGGPDHAGWPAWIVDRVDRFGPGIFHEALTRALATTPSFGAPAPPGRLHDRIDRLYHELAGAGTETAAVVASLFDGLLSASGQWLSSVVAVGWRTSLLLGGDVLALTVFDIALTPGNPLEAGADLRLDVTATGRGSAAGTSMWDRRGRANTRFHHYFDQIVHLDATAEDRPTGLSCSVSTDGATLPALSAEVPDALGDAPHALRSAPLADSSGAVVGTIRFDTRRLGREAASRELAESGRWTEATAEAYANALGAAMVEPILAMLAPAPPA